MLIAHSHIQFSPFLRLNSRRWAVRKNALAYWKLADRRSHEDSEQQREDREGQREKRTVHVTRSQRAAGCTCSVQSGCQRGASERPHWGRARRPEYCTERAGAAAAALGSPPGGSARLRSFSCTRSAPSTDPISTTHRWRARLLH